MRFVRFLATLKVVAVLSVWGITVSAAPPEQPGMPEHLRQAFIDRHSPERIAKLQRALDAQQRHSKALTQQAGVLGTGVGWAADGEPVVKLYIRNTRSQTGLPQKLDGIDVQVESLGGMYALFDGMPCEDIGTCDDGFDVSITSGEPSSQTDWHERPVPIGVSISNSWGTEAGTLACRVSNGCHKYALSNAHVLRGSALTGNANNAKTLQPGTYDGGIPVTDQIAELESWVDIVLSTSPLTNNRVDAAISRLYGPTVGTATRSDGYGEPRTQIIASPSVGMAVKKYGRTTAYSTGYIDAINVNLIVEFPPGLARFQGQILIRGYGGSAFSGDGDSGSLVVIDGGANDRKPVGLIFAGGTLNNEPVSLANQIDEVLNLLGVSIDGDPN